MPVLDRQTSTRSSPGEFEVNHSVKISFGMIVLNGEPFTAYNLRALYPYAHQIIVVEGACRSARNIATPDGHSMDRTLDVIRRFQAEEDPEGKVLLVTAEDEGYPDGFWEEKTEMSQAYARRATGNYLWQVDSDEFYLPQDMESIIGILRNDPEIKMVGFRTLTFWGSTSYVVDGHFLQDVVGEFRRLFAWDSSYSYVEHRPPTVHDAEGRDLRSMKHLAAEDTYRLGVVMHHYSLLLPKQVTEKCEYYSKAEWRRDSSDLEWWARECFFALGHPFRAHPHFSSISWLDRYTGPHHPQVLAMIRDIEAGLHEDVALRDNADVEALLASRSYQLKRFAIKSLVGPRRAARRMDRALRSALKRTPIGPALRRCRGVLKGQQR